MSNVYAAPAADFSSVTDEAAGDARLFSLNGRIGRVRWIGYNAGIWMLASLLVGVLGSVFARNQNFAVQLLPLVSTALMLIGYMIMCRRRLHDLGTTPWLMLLSIVPVINLYFFFMMIFKRGDEFANEYGPKPPPNDRAAHLLAWLFPAIFLIGILAAIALPAYKHYSDRTKASQQSVQAPR